MKRILTALALALSAIAAPSASIKQAKPTVALKIPKTGFHCGVFSSRMYNCFGLPVITVRNGVSTTGYLWTDNYAAAFGNKGFVYVYNFPVPNAVINSMRSTPDGAVQEDISGPNYTGKIILYFTTKHSCSGGRGGGCHTNWTIPAQELHPDQLELENAKAPLFQYRKGNRRSFVSLSFCFPITPAPPGPGGRRNCAQIGQSNSSPADGQRKEAPRTANRSSDDRR